MKDLDELIAAMGAVASEHGTSDDDDGEDSEAGQDATEEGADKFRRRYTSSMDQAERLLAKVEFQADVALQRKYNDEKLKAIRSQPGNVATLIDDIKRKQLRSLEAKTAALQNELALKQATKAQLAEYSKAYIALETFKKPNAKRKYSDPNNWRENATLEFRNKQL